MKIVPDSYYSEEHVIEYSQLKQYNHQVNNEWYNIVDYINYTPNWLHKDGRIYASANGEDYKVAEVSPYNPLFKTQIEEGIWPLVEALFNKGYLTCSSCEGHGRDLNAEVSIVFPSIESAYEFVELVKFDPWEIKVESTRTIYDYESCDKTTKNILSREQLKAKVFPYYNKIFCRNYSEYFYVDMFLPKFCGYNFSWNWLTKTKSKKYEESMGRMVYKINNDIPYSVY